MAKVETYTASRELRLDCGHKVSLGRTYVVTKTFTCQADVGRPLHAALTQILEALENGVIHLKHLEWDLRHAERSA